MNTERTQRAWLLALIVLGLAALALAGWLWGATLWDTLTDEALVQSYVVRAGAWGPLVLILLNVLQIVIAIIPGHVVQLAAGYLYGPYWGFLYAAIGLLIGAMTAMALARFFGRPLAKWMIGEARLQKWEKVTHSDSTWVWTLLMAGPIGDIPFVLAGLSSVSFTKIFLLTLFVRVPSAFLSTAVGGGLIPYYWMIILVIIAAAITLVALRFKSPLENWFDGAINSRLAPGIRPVAAPEGTLEPSPEMPSSAPLHPSVGNER